MTSTRQLALTVLDDVWQKSGKPKNAIEKVSIDIDERERSFLMEMVYGVLRHRDTLDWALRKFLDKPSGLNQNTINNLRLAAYQILFMRVPGWAAVNEAVKLEKRKGRPGLVNAVLRNLLRTPEDQRLNLEAISKKNPVQGIALSMSYPQWLISRWVKRFGRDEAMRLAEAGNAVPSLTLRVNSLKSTREQVISALSLMGIEAEATSHSPDGVRLRGFRHFRGLSGLEGLVVVQDEASQLIGYLLHPQPGERILDACSAPGGKTTHIAQLMGDRGEIVALDIDGLRLERLRDNVSTLRLRSIRIVAADIVKDDMEGLSSFDRILLDAPCSSIGVIRKNPDIKYRHSPAGLIEFKMKQKEMLLSASKLLKPGGVMVYSVCSTEPEEGEEVVEEFLKESAEFYIIDTDLPFLGGFMKAGIFRTFPHKDDMDGFFGVRLCKRA